MTAAPPSSPRGRGTRRAMGAEGCARDRDWPNGTRRPFPGLDQTKASPRASRFNAQACWGLSTRYRAPEGSTPRMRPTLVRHCLAVKTKIRSESHPSFADRPCRRPPPPGGPFGFGGSAPVSGRPVVEGTPHLPSPRRCPPGGKSDQHNAGQEGAPVFQAELPSRSPLATQRAA